MCLGTSDQSGQLAPKITVKLELESKLPQTSTPIWNKPLTLSTFGHIVINVIILVEKSAGIIIIR